MVRYNKKFSAVLCFVIYSFGSCSGSSVESAQPLRTSASSALKMFLNSLVKQYPTKEFAVCVTDDKCSLIVDAEYINLSIDDASSVRSVDLVNSTGPSEEVVTSSEPAVQVPLTAFHVATMSAHNGYHELPRPPKVIITPTVLNRPQDQHVGAAPMGHLVPSIPSSVWRSVSDRHVLFWAFVGV